MAAFSLAGHHRGHWRLGSAFFAFCKGSKIAGTVCILTNITVLAYYGFIAVFFAIGETR